MVVLCSALQEAAGQLSSAGFSFSERAGVTWRTDLGSHGVYVGGNGAVSCGGMVFEIWGMHQIDTVGRTIGYAGVLLIGCCRCLCFLQVDLEEAGLPPTTISYHGQEVNVPRNPARWARCRYGVHIYRHALHWMVRVLLGFIETLM